MIEVNLPFRFETSLDVLESISVPAAAPSDCSLSDAARSAFPERLRSVVLRASFVIFEAGHHPLGGWGRRRIGK
jgi:hypothetical protein